jgi:hypothetical protein
MARVIQILWYLQFSKNLTPFMRGPLFCYLPFVPVSAFSSDNYSLQSPAGHRQHPVIRKTLRPTHPFILLAHRESWSKNVMYWFIKNGPGQLTDW